MWFKEDIRNILAGIELSSVQLATYCLEGDTEAYRAGFRAAILAVAASFGVLSDGTANDSLELLSHEKTITVRMRRRQLD